MSVIFTDNGFVFFSFHHSNVLSANHVGDSACHVVDISFNDEQSLTNHVFFIFFSNVCLLLCLIAPIIAPALS